MSILTIVLQASELSRCLWTTPEVWGSLWKESGRMPSRLLTLCRIDLHPAGLQATVQRRSQQWPSCTVCQNPGSVSMHTGDYGVRASLQHLQPRGRWIQEGEGIHSGWRCWKQHASLWWGISLCTSSAGLSRDRDYYTSSIMDASIIHYSWSKTDKSMVRDLCTHIHIVQEIKRILLLDLGQIES